MLSPPVTQIAAVTITTTDCSEREKYTIKADPGNMPKCKQNTTTSTTWRATAAIWVPGGLNVSK